MRCEGFNVRDLEIQVGSGSRGIRISAPEIFLPKGSVTFLVGRNGSGKTSMLRALSKGVVTRNSQISAFSNIKVGGDFQFWSSTSYVSDRFSDDLVDELSVDDHLRVVGASPVSIERTRFEDWTISLHGKRVGNLSSGERQILIGAMILRAFRGPITLADEIGSNLDWDMKRELYFGIKQFCETSESACFLVTHDLELVSELSDEVYFLDDLDPDRTCVLVPTASAIVSLRNRRGAHGVGQS